MHRFAILILAVVATGCAPALTLESAWQGDGRTVGPFRHVLVVGVSQSFDRRRFFEVAAADTLRAAGATATASTAQMTTRDPLDRERITALVAATGADAVLVTRIVNQDVALRSERGRVVAKADSSVDVLDRYDPSVYTLYRYDFTVGVEPDRLVVDREAAVRTELFAAATGAVVYRIDSRVRLSAAESRSFSADVAVLDRVGRALAARLVRDGVVGAAVR